MTMAPKTERLDVAEMERDLEALDHESQAERFSAMQGMLRKVLNGLKVAASDWTFYSVQEVRKLEDLARELTSRIKTHDAAKKRQGA